MKQRFKKANYGFIFVLCLLFASGCQDSIPRQIHLSVQGDAATSVTITWVTMAQENTETHTVMYGRSPGEYTHVAAGISKKLPNKLFGYVHEVKLTELQPNTTYYYVCGDEIGGLSEEQSFATAPEDVQDISFVVIADMGISLEALKNLTLMISEAPSFVLHAGDLSYANGNSLGWDVWFEMIAPLAANVSYMPSIGNHEVENLLGVSSYRGRFALPHNERWYSYDWGNVHIVSLDTQSLYIPESNQLEWLEDDLIQASADPGIEWIIVFFHIPPYSSSLAHGSNLLVRNNICPVLEAYEVDVVFNGHDHTYERSFPIYDGQVIDDHPNEYHNPAGTIYVVTGGGGKSLYEIGSDYWTAYTESIYQHVKVDILQKDKTLYLQSVSSNGDLIDECWIYK